MFRRVPPLLAALALMSLPVNDAAAQGNCATCDLPPGCRGNGNGNGHGNDKDQCSIVLLNVESDIDFGRLVLVGGSVGHAVIDLSTGAKLVFGDLGDAGGMPIYGTALVTGEPLRNIMVTLPASVTMTDPAGSTAVMRDFVTDLPAMPRLDSTGTLRFNFVGTLYTDAAVLAGGTLRGRVPITVDYN